MVNRRTHKILTWAGTLTIAAWTAGCQPARSWPAIHPQRVPWTSPAGQAGLQITTDHFEVRLTGPEDPLLDYLGPFLETTFAEFVKLAPPPRPTDRPLLVYLFETRPEWAAFTKRQFPLRAPTYLHIHNGGYTDHRTATAVAFGRARDRTLSLLAHEAMHQYFARYFPRPVPPWLNEGLACQWEAFELDGPHPIFTPRRNFLRRNHLREALSLEEGLIDLPTLMSMDAGRAIRETGQPLRAYYAQIWSLVLYLREGDQGAWADRFAALLADVGTDRLAAAVHRYRADHSDARQLSPGPILFRAYITEDLADFAAHYRAFAEALVG